MTVQPMPPSPFSRTTLAPATTSGPRSSVVTSMWMRFFVVRSSGTGWKTIASNGRPDDAFDVAPALVARDGAAERVAPPPGESVGGVLVARDVPDELVGRLRDRLVPEEDAELLPVGVEQHRPAGLLVVDHGAGVECGCSEAGPDVQVQPVLDDLGLRHPVDPHLHLVTGAQARAAVVVRV